MTFNLHEIYEKYAPMAYRRCYKLIGDEDLAFDALQDLYIKLKNVENFHRVENPAGYIYKAATNISLNIIKMRKKLYFNDDRVFHNLLLHSDDHEQKMIISEILDKIFDSELEGTKELAVMYYIDGLTYNEISDETGMSVSGIRKRLRNLKNNVIEKYNSPKRLLA